MSTSTGSFAASPSTGSFAASAAVFGVCLLGFLVRSYQLGDQIIMGDEIWTVHAALGRDLSYVLTHHHSTDFSIPLALWDKLMIAMGGLSEWGARIPVFLLGCSMIPVAWWLAAGRLSSLEAFAVAALVAFSPILVLYSRFARPYIGVAAFVLVALLSWLRWLESARLRWAIASAAFAALAVYCNVLAVPALVGMWVAGLAAGWIGDDEREPMRARTLPSLGVIALGAALALALYAPSLRSFVVAHTVRGDTGVFTLDGTWGALHFLFGARFAPLLVWLLASTLLGGFAMARRTPRLLAVLLAMPLAQLAVVVWMSPPLVQWSYVLGRYLMPSLVGPLVLLAVGLVAQARSAAEWIARRSERLESVRGTELLLLALLVLIVATGPLPGVFAGANAFTSHPDDHAPPVPVVREDRVSPIYGFLAHAEGDGAVVEVPWTRAYRFTPYATYQGIHGRPVWSASHYPLFTKAGLRFRGVRPIAALREEGLDADYVVVHKRVAAEMSHVAPGPHAGRAPTGGGVEIPPLLQLLHDETVSLALRAVRDNPTLSQVYEDEWVVVFAAQGAARPDP